MLDLANELRRYAKHDGHSTDTHVAWRRICHQAADELDRLNAMRQAVYDEVRPKDIDVGRLMIDTKGSGSCAFA